jgi:methyl-accepting chemotaxis protein
MRVRVKDLRVGVRLGVVMGAVLVLLCVVSGIGLIGLSGQQDATKSIESYNVTTHAAMQVKFRSADFNGWQTAYALDMVLGNEAATEEGGSRPAFLASADAFKKELDALSRLRVSDAQQALITASSKLFEQFMVLDEEILADYQAGTPARTARANELVLVDEIEIFNKIAGNVEELVTGIDADAKRAAADAEAGATQARITMIALSAVALVLTAALAWLLIRSITRPLGGLRHGLTLITDGDLTQRVDEDRRDELGQVAAGFNQLATRMQDVIGQVAEGARRVSDASVELSDVSQRLASTADETSVQASVVSSSTAQVSTMVTTMAAAAEEMHASIDEITQSATKAAEVAEAGVRDAEAANQTVATLGAATSEIGSVAKLISSIAEQTNLLALNATIEAARAGESGKGFAVVAGEVKELARQTATATEDIVSRIKAIEDGSEQAISAIRQIGQVVADISGTQTVIAAAVEEQSATTSEMTRNVQETATGASEIAANITGVATATEDTSAAANSARHTADTLNEAATELQTLIGTFRY